MQFLYLIGQKNVGPKWRIFLHVTKIWADENLRPKKIKVRLSNLCKREVTNFLSKCVQKFTVPIWVKFESEKTASSDYHLFFFYHMIIPMNNPFCMYRFQMRWFGWYFNIGRTFSILKLRKYLISKPIIIHILNEKFRRLIYWQIQWLERISESVRYCHDFTVIFSTEFLQCIIVLPFKCVHNYQGMLL